MPYCTQSDLATRFGAAELIQLTDRANTGTADAAVIAQAIADASAEIDGYLEGAYALPLAVVPVNLTRIACDLARYRLYENQPTETVSERYKAGVRYLELVAQGKISLGPSGSGALTAPDGDSVAFGNASPAVFGRDAE